MATKEEIGAQRRAEIKASMAPGPVEIRFELARDKKPGSASKYIDLDASMAKLRELIERINADGGKIGTIRLEISETFGAGGWATADNDVTGRASEIFRGNDWVVYADKASGE